MKMKCVIKNVLRMKSAGELAQTVILYSMAYQSIERLNRLVHVENNNILQKWDRKIIESC